MLIDEIYKKFLEMIGMFMACLIIVNLFLTAILAGAMIDKVRLEKELLRLEIQAYEASNDL